MHESAHYAVYSDSTPPFDFIASSWTRRIVPSPIPPSNGTRSPSLIGTIHPSRVPAPEEVIGDKAKAVLRREDERACLHHRVSGGEGRALRPEEVERGFNRTEGESRRSQLADARHQRPSAIGVSSGPVIRTSDRDSPNHNPPS